MSKSHGPSKHVSGPVDLINQPGADAAAFEATAAARAALTTEDLLRVSTDVASAAAIVIGAAPRILEFAEKIRGVSDIPADVVDTFLKFAQSANHANLVWLNATAGADEVQKLHIEVAPIRLKFLAVLDLGVAFAIIDPGVVSRIRAGSGYRDEAEDVMAAAAEIEIHWPELEGKTPITKRDLTHGRDRASALIRAVALREAEALPTVTAATSDRARAWTLMFRSYDQIRRAISHIRWSQRDLDEIAPSMFNGPGGGHHTAADANAKAAGDHASTTTAGAAHPATPATPAAPAAAAGPSGTPFTG